MMAKIVTAMHETPDTAPIVFTGERPAAKIYVVLGSKAMIVMEIVMKVETISRKAQ